MAFRGRTGSAAAEQPDVVPREQSDLRFGDFAEACSSARKQPRARPRVGTHDGDAPQLRDFAGAPGMTRTCDTRVGKAKEAQVVTRGCISGLVSPVSSGRTRPSTRPDGPMRPLHSHGHGGVGGLGGPRPPRRQRQNRARNVVGLQHERRLGRVHAAGIARGQNLDRVARRTRHHRNRAREPWLAGR